MAAILKEGPLRKALREKGLVKHQGQDWIMDWLRRPPRPDVVSIDGFIRDENSDVEKYNAAATYLKDPLAKALAQQLAIEEGQHAAAWKTVKARLTQESQQMVRT